MGDIISRKNHAKEKIFDQEGLLDAPRRFLKNVCKLKQPPEKLDRHFKSE